MIGCLSLTCFLVFGPPGVALDPGFSAPAAGTAPATSVQAFGRANSCAAWSDGCTTCNRPQPGQPAACSTPGIACTPGPVACAAPSP